MIFIRAMGLGRFSYPCGVINVLADVWVVEVIKVLVEVCVIKMFAAVVIDTFSGV